MLGVAELVEETLVHSSLRLAGGLGQSDRPREVVEDLATIADALLRHRYPRTTNAIRNTVGALGAVTRRTPWLARLAILALFLVW